MHRCWVSTRFARISGSEPVLALGFTVSWEIEPEYYREYRFWVAESERVYLQQIQRFRRSLWFWLALATLVLLAVQGAILRWSLQPVRHLARQIREVEAGQRTQLSGTDLAELQPLIHNLNVLIEQGRSRLVRYRDTLSDLAHSLKTPLAVMRSALDGSTSAADLRQTVHTQIERMDQTVAYQLQRAAASGRITLAPVAIAPLAKKIADSLAKVYCEKQLNIVISIDPNSRFHGDEGDLYEILGNLADNACKWACAKVKISAHQSTAHPALQLGVEDDGPGIPSAQLAALLERGARADTATPGHGIGLAVVRAIVEDVYGGELTLQHSDFGGLCAMVKLPLVDEHQPHSQKPCDLRYR